MYDGRGETLVSTAVTKLAVTIVAPAEKFYINGFVSAISPVEFTAFCESEHMRPGAIGKADHSFVAKGLHLCFISSDRSSLRYGVLLYI